MTVWLTSSLSRGGTPETFWNTESLFAVNTRPLEVAKCSGTRVKSHSTVCLPLELSTFKIVQEPPLSPLVEELVQRQRGALPRQGGR